MDKKTPKRCRREERVSQVRLHLLSNRYILSLQSFISPPPVSHSRSDTQAHKFPDKGSIWACCSLFNFLRILITLGPTALLLCSSFSLVLQTKVSTCQPDNQSRTWNMHIIGMQTHRNTQTDMQQKDISRGSQTTKPVWYSSQSYLSASRNSGGSCHQWSFSFWMLFYLEFIHCILYQREKTGAVSMFLLFIVTVVRDAYYQG